MKATKNNEQIVLKIMYKKIKSKKWSLNELLTLLTLKIYLN